MQLPQLSRLIAYRIEIALGLLGIIMLANLRGLRETGTLMSVPVYLFLFTYIPMLVYGGIRLLLDGPTPMAQLPLNPCNLVTLFLILHTFATGCTALTGIEAISNGVPAFKSPESKNAGHTLIVDGHLDGHFICRQHRVDSIPGYYRRTTGNHPFRPGSTSARQWLRLCIHPDFHLAHPGSGSQYQLCGFSTPVCYPRQGWISPPPIYRAGDRLVFTNGIIFLAIATGILIVIFRGNSHLLIPLFAIGAFLAFTLSQSGMVIHWFRERSKNWRLKAILNGLGALATATTLIVISISKFREGAWITVLLIPMFVIAFRRIHQHYQDVGKQLSLRGLPPDLKPLPPLRLVIPVSGVHRGIFEAMDFAHLHLQKYYRGLYRAGPWCG